MVFASCEGLDGSGKDTALEAIDEEFDCTITSEPSEMWTGKHVRDVLQREDSPPLLDFYLFMADRVNHIEEVVRPVDERGGLVVSGRYADSTRVYQPVALTDAGVFESQWEAKDFIERTMAPWNYEPDATLYLDISVDTAIQRASGEEKYENREFLEQVRANYEALVQENPERFVRIDAEQSPKRVREEVIKVVGDMV